MPPELLCPSLELCFSEAAISWFDSKAVFREAPPLLLLTAKGTVGLSIWTAIVRRSVFLFELTSSKASSC